MPRCERSAPVSERVGLAATDQDAGGAVIAKSLLCVTPGQTRDGLVAHFNPQGLPCLQGSCFEIYLEKAFDGTGFRPPERLPVARKLGETSLMFLVHPGVSRVEVALP